MIDEVIVEVKAGKGGDGCVSFWKEKFRPRGGPDGGDGGRGGNVILEASNEVNTLTFFANRKVFQGEAGENGKNRKRAGKDGENLVLKAPVGTLVTEIPGSKVLVDLVEPQQKILLACGGGGGRGNVHFATPTRQAPRFAERGQPGEEKRLKLELKLIADLGIIGLPNSGKSTLLSAISRAHPKIADYPFTTLEPVLGVIKFKKKKVVVADIPGLIEGSHRGKGLGDKFLRHIERTKVLIHLIDGTCPSPHKAYQTVRNELKKFKPELLKKPEILVINKIDIAPFPHLKGFKSKPILISAQKKTGLEKLLAKIEKTI